jgi:hypothetical protein
MSSERSRTIAAWVGVGLLVATNLVAIAVHDTRGGDRMDQVVAHVGHVDSLLVSQQRLLSAMQSTDSALNYRQLVNAMSIGAIVASLRARGIQVYLTEPRRDE